MLYPCSQRGDEDTSPTDYKLPLSRFSGLIDKWPDKRQGLYIESQGVWSFLTLKFIYFLQVLSTQFDMSITYKRINRSLDYEIHFPHSPSGSGPGFIYGAFSSCLNRWFYWILQRIVLKLIQPKMYIPLFANGLLRLYLRPFKEVN